MKRYTERIRENEYATGNAIIEELKIDENNEDEDYILEQQKNIINTLDNKLGKLEDLAEELGCPLEVLLEAKKSGFYDTVSFWKSNEFVIDYDFIKNDFCLRSIRNNDTLGDTKFYAKDHKKTWWLKEDKSE